MRGERKRKIRWGADKGEGLGLFSSAVSLALLETALAVLPAVLAGEEAPLASEPSVGTAEALSNVRTSESEGSKA